MKHIFGIFILETIVAISPLYADDICPDSRYNLLGDIGSAITAAGALTPDLVLTEGTCSANTVSLNNNVLYRFPILCGDDNIQAQNIACWLYKPATTTEITLADTTGTYGWANNVICNGLCMKSSLKSVSNYAKYPATDVSNTSAYVDAILWGKLGADTGLGHIAVLGMCAREVGTSTSDTREQISFTSDDSGITETACWCKMIYPAISDWVYSGVSGFSTAGDCWMQCNVECEKRLIKGSALNPYLQSAHEIY